MRPIDLDSTKSTGPTGTLLRLGVVGAIIIGVTSAVACPDYWLSPARFTQDPLMAAFQTTNTAHPVSRRDQAQGVFVTGWFESAGQAVKLPRTEAPDPKRAPLLRTGGIQPGTDGSATERSSALRFLPAGEGQFRIGTNVVPVLAVPAHPSLMAASDPATLPAPPFEPAGPAVKAGQHALFDDVLNLIVRHPMQWRLMLTMAPPTSDETVFGPAGRRHSETGMGSIDHAEGSS